MIPRADRSYTHWTLTYAFSLKTALLLSSTGGTSCWKQSSDILVNTDITASYQHFLQICWLHVRDVNLSPPPHPNIALLH